MRILFMCVANSARSQMAEGLARSLLRENAETASAGSQPTQLNPLATQVMAEIAIDISAQRSKTWDQLPSDFRQGLNYIITLCKEEVCPVTPDSQAVKLHWPFPDPAAVSGPEAVRLQSFRSVRDQIQTRLEEFVQRL